MNNRFVKFNCSNLAATSCSVEFQSDCTLLKEIFPFLCQKCTAFAFFLFCSTVTQLWTADGL